MMTLLGIFPERIMRSREEEKPYVKNFEKEQSSITLLTHRSHAIENLETEKEMKKNKKVPDHEFNIQLFTDRIDGEILSIQTHLCEQMQLVPEKKHQNTTLYDLNFSHMSNALLYLT